MTDYPIFTSRYIDIDGDTRVGFNYIKQQFYVTNKTYTTYRTEEEDIINVLATLGITEDNYPTVIAGIPSLKSTYETLLSASFTLQDNGAYIHTIQFNDFSDNPLTIDCEKAKLYIMNTSIVYDLTVNESARNVRIPRLLSYYKDTLGLEITLNDMTYFYSLLLSYYYPKCYNQVELHPTTNTYFYNNKITLSNYSNTSLASYTCTSNPNNTAPLTPVGYVVATNSTDNTLITSTPVTDTELKGYLDVILQGATDTIEGSEYSADNTYTITSIEDNTIQVAETIPYSYSFPYKECYVLSADYTITAMKREGSLITLSATPSNLKVGDVIIVSGATVSSTYETISCNGTYTVAQIGTVGSDGTQYPKNIIVEEEIPTDFTGSATLIKEVFVGNISQIVNNEETSTITLVEPTDLTMTNAQVMVHTISNGTTTIENYTGSTTSTTTIEVTSTTIAPYNYTDTCPVLYIPVPMGETEFLIDVTSVSDDVEGHFPTGEFMVDNFEQCQAYIGLLAQLEKPKNPNKTNLYKQIENPMPLEPVKDLTRVNTIMLQCSLTDMTFLGLYSHVYSEDENS